MEPDATTKTLVAELARRPRRIARAPPATEGDAAPASALPLPDRPSIAVLPFANMSGDPEQDYFADGIVEDILTALCRAVRWLFVIARNSSFAYKGRAVDVKQIGRELGVRYVVEGSVRKAGNRVRVTAQLIEAETGAHIWADRYERDLSDIFALQDEITQKVVAAIAPSLRALEIRRAQAKPTENLRAYDLLPARAAGDSRARPRRAPSAPRRCCARPSSWIPAIPKRWACWPISSPPAPSTAGTRTSCAALEEACEMSRRALMPGPENSTCLACAASTYVLLGRRFEEGLRPGRARAAGCIPTPCSCATGPAPPTSTAARATRRWSSSRRRGA